MKVEYGEDLDSALKRVRRQGYTDNDFKKQEEKIAQLKKEHNALLEEEIDLQKDWNQWAEPGYELESAAYDRSQKEEELSEARKKYGEMSQSPYVERKLKLGRENYDKLMGKTNDKEIEGSIKSLYIYQDEKNMGSLRENPLGKYYDKYGKENVDRVWKKMDDKYAIIKGTAMDSEGLRYNELVEKDKHSPEAIQYLQNRTEQAYKNYYGDSRKYNEEIAQAKTEFENFGREARARAIDKINEGTPLQDMANDRIKEKQNTLANDKAMLEGMKRNGINEVQGWTQKDFENRIKKNEDYLDVAKSNKEESNKIYATAFEKYGSTDEDIYQESIKANQPVGEQTRQLIKEMNVKTFAEETDNAQATIERFKERKGKIQDTYTKTGNIRYSAFGIERTPEGDFSDDGTRFTAYRLPNGMEMTVAKANDEIFMSVRHPYNKEISYEEYSKLPHYKD